MYVGQVFNTAKSLGLTRWEQIRYEFPAMPDIADSNLFLDPQRSWLLFRPGKDKDLWRLVYTEDPKASDDDLVAECSKTIRELIPGHPEEMRYELKDVRPYKIHQRIVNKMRKGRFMLASDAAHLCCP